MLHPDQSAVCCVEINMGKTMANDHLADRRCIRAVAVPAPRFHQSIPLVFDLALRTFMQALSES